MLNSPKVIRKESSQAQFDSKYNADLFFMVRNKSHIFRTLNDSVDNSNSPAQWEESEGGYARSICSGLPLVSRNLPPGGRLLPEAVLFPYIVPAVRSAQLDQALLLLLHFICLHPLLILLSSALFLQKKRRNDSLRNRS